MNTNAGGSKAVIAAKDACTLVLYFILNAFKKKKENPI